MSEIDKLIALLEGEGSILLQKARLISSRKKELANLLIEYISLRKSKKFARNAKVILLELLQKENLKLPREFMN